MPESARSTKQGAAEISEYVREVFRRLEQAKGEGKDEKSGAQSTSSKQGAIGGGCTNDRVNSGSGRGKDQNRSRVAGQGSGNVEETVEQIAQKTA